MPGPRHSLVRARPLVVFAAIVQAGHAFEHVAQVWQRAARLAVTPHGLLGEHVDFEWLHLGFNLSVTALLVVAFLTAGLHLRGSRERAPLAWWGLAAAIGVEGALHLPEHVARMWQYAVLGWNPPPGILGRTMVHPQGPFDVLTLHAFYNVVVAGAIAAGAVGVWRPDLRPRPWPARWMALGAASVVLAACVGGEPMDTRGMDTSQPVGIVRPTGPIPGCQPVGDGSVVRVVAQGVRYEPHCLSAPPGVPFTLELENRDEGIKHNVAIFAGPRMYSVNAPLLYRSGFLVGPGSLLERVEGLPPGTWEFHCDIHPENMIGVFTVPVAVTDAGFDPTVVALPQGTSLAFRFDPANVEEHSVSDAAGVYGGEGGMLDSGGQPGGTMFSFKFVAAGRYDLVDGSTGATAVVDVPVRSTPDRGTEGTRFRLTWSLFPLEGFTHDVEVQRPGGRWEPWQDRVEETEAYFGADAGPGTYRFRARAVSPDGMTGWSSVLEVVVEG